MSEAERERRLTQDLLYINEEITRVNDIQEKPVETSQYYISTNHPVSQSYIYQTPSTK